MNPITANTRETRFAFGMVSPLDVSICGIGTRRSRFFAALPCAATATREHLWIGERRLRQTAVWVQMRQLSTGKHRFPESNRFPESDDGHLLHRRQAQR